jgi:hypothetical protein
MHSKLAIEIIIVASIKCLPENSDNICEGKDALVLLHFSFSIDISIESSSSSSSSSSKLMPTYFFKNE